MRKKILAITSFTEQHKIASHNRKNFKGPSLTLNRKSAIGVPGFHFAFAMKKNGERYCCSQLFHFFCDCKVCSNLSGLK